MLKLFIYVKFTEIFLLFYFLSKLSLLIYMFSFLPFSLDDIHCPNSC